MRTNNEWNTFIKIALNIVFSIDIVLEAACYRCRYCCSYVSLAELAEKERKKTPTAEKLHSNKYKLQNAHAHVWSSPVWREDKRKLLGGCECKYYHQIKVCFSATTNDVCVCGPCICIVPLFIVLYYSTHSILFLCNKCVCVCFGSNICTLLFRVGCGLKRIFDVEHKRWKISLKPMMMMTAIYAWDYGWAMTQWRTQRNMSTLHTHFNVQSKRNWK